MAKFIGYCLSPIGKLALCFDDGILEAIQFDNSAEKLTTTEPKFFTTVRIQLEEYFSQQRKTFTIDFHLKGTEFQQNVWQALRNISYGETVSYLELAKNIANPKVVRAVGNANRSNPLPIIIPCHRVIATNGSLHGYAGGLWQKKWLLTHEGC